ncbi:hypothetical protein VM1G_11922 [Cytospora mali]|uniref:Uncharacterized protein n=1 Tax=Cytospora mali TaxID=578113 RepID=A0A194WD49_CYTMA|nr:hypothetical protein VM1G_11922 [Valsa mali]
MTGSQLEDSLRGTPDLVVNGQDHRATPRLEPDHQVFLVGPSDRISCLSRPIVMDVLQPFYLYGPAACVMAKQPLCMGLSNVLQSSAPEEHCEHADAPLASGRAQMWHIVPEVYLALKRLKQAITLGA